VSPHSITATNGSPGRRLAFLDALRAIAVLLVLVQHVGEQTWAPIAELSANVVDLGQLGVMVFFCCSGFIIPVSLRKGGSLSRFWISRFFRLYPLYWLTVLAAFLAFRYLDYATPTSTTGDWLANVTMAQRYLGHPDAIGLYWSLAWELAFYAVMSVLFVVRLHGRAVLMSTLVNLALVAAVLLWPVLLPGRHFSIGTFSLAMMFCGYVLNQWHSHEVAGRTAAAVVAATSLTGVVVLWRTTATGTIALDAATVSRDPVPIGASWLAALAIFVLVLVFLGGRGVHIPWPLRRIGVISYSVYLIQGLVIGLLAIEDRPGWLSAVVWSIATIAISEATYRWVEKPAIDVGHRIGKRLRRPAAQR
jgi:peptidoglycan/LPS O-acetylase OafA/YrhL